MQTIQPFPYWFVTLSPFGCREFVERGRGLVADGKKIFGVAFPAALCLLNFSVSFHKDN